MGSLAVCLRVGPCNIDWAAWAEHLQSPLCHGLAVCVAENDDGVEEQGFRWLSNSSKSPASDGGKRILVLRKMLYINVVLAIEITKKNYFVTSLRLQRFRFWVAIGMQRNIPLLKCSILVESFSLLFPGLWERGVSLNWQSFFYFRRETREMVLVVLVLLLLLRGTLCSLLKYSLSVATL